MKLRDIYKTTSSSSVYNKIHRRQVLSCSYCPPHRGENAGPSYYKRKKKEYQLDPNRRHR